MTPQPSIEEAREAEAFHVEDTSKSDLKLLPPPNPPDSHRIIAHFDADCFYAQCEELRDPFLATQPIGVTQKFLIVTCNYPARCRGVSKLMAIKDAVKRCPGLILINGEDLTPYREASKQMFGVLCRYGSAAEKLGLDEVFVDITAQVDARILHSSSSSSSSSSSRKVEWVGHVHDPHQRGPLVQDSQHRPMDLRIGSDGTVNTTSSVVKLIQLQKYENEAWYQRLAMGSLVAQEARQAVKIETGLRTSAGVACNKMLAKLVGGLHKPDDQTVLLPPFAAAFVAPLPIRALPGIGHKTEGELRKLGVETVACARDLVLTEVELKRVLGDKVGGFVAAARWGNDASPVLDQGPPKSITVEDSFMSCQGMAAARHVIKILIPDLLQRLREEEEERNGRRPTKLVLKWRVRGQGWKRTSASCAFPDLRINQQGEGDAVEVAAVRLLSANLKEPFDLTLINIGASSFVEEARRNRGGGGGGCSRSVAEMFGGKKKVVLQQQQQESVFLPKVPVAGPSAHLKIGSSSDGDGGNGLGEHRDELSKHGQRQLREMNGGNAGAIATAAVDEKARDDVAEDVDVDEACLWDELAELHCSKRVKRPNSQFYINRNTSSGNGGAAVPSPTPPLPPQQSALQSDAPTTNITAPLQHDYLAVPRRDTSISELHSNNKKPATVTYRNAEALALQAIFSGGGPPIGIERGDDDDDDGNDDESLKLALKLQREEAVGAAAAALTMKKTAQEQGRKGKKRGPLDGFIVNKQHK